jgi:hypothetical protein
MWSIAGDPFLDGLHDMVELAGGDERARLAENERMHLERLSRARDLISHVGRRFSGLASAGRGVEYVRLEPPPGEEVPATHALHWRVSRPHRTLEIRLSERTGRYWFHLLVRDEVAGSVRIVDDGQGDVLQMTADTVDTLIRRLVDQTCWRTTDSA